MEEAAVVQVVAAVIEGALEHSERILICQRKDRGRHALKWEFPGGKVEPGEHPREALARELREELGIEAHIAEELGRYDFQYGPQTITRLMFFRVTQFTEPLQNLDFTQILWEKREKLLSYDFLEGDLEFVRRLAQIKPKTFETPDDSVAS